MLMHGLGINRGGMTSAMLARSHYFYEYGIKGDIVTFDFNPDYNELLNILKTQKMDVRTNLINMFDYFAEQSLTGKGEYENTSASYKKMLTKFNEVKVTGNTSKFFDRVTGDYRFFVRYENQNIKVIDEVVFGKRVKRSHFKNEMINHVEQFNQLNQKIYEIFYNSEGTPYISRQLNPETQAINNSYLLSEQKYFKNNTELAQHFLNQIVDDDTAIISDGPGSFPKMLNLENKNVKLFSVIHAHHYKYWNENKELKPAIKFIFDNAHKLDGLIALTDGQKVDIQNDFKFDNVFTISNFVELHAERDKKYQDKIVGTISRFTKEKGFDRLLDVAKLVVASNPEIKFHLYGSGEYLSEIKKRIAELKLEENVILKGFTNDVQDVLNTFDLFISASYYEGQGLSMMEAMDQKVPVASFDIKYGPSDFIENQVNGILVPDHDVDQMAKEIVETLSNRNLTEMGMNARNTMHNQYNPDVIMSKWVQLLDGNSN